MSRRGGLVLADVAPSGGRHIYVLFAAALPWLELRDLARALAFRFPSIDTAPMSSLGGQISPPGSRHKPGRDHLGCVRRAGTCCRSSAQTGHGLPRAGLSCTFLVEST
ncbi:MAG: hypothetical protein ACRDNT_11510 [Streptosporangiaceae bacterium]